MCLGEVLGKEGRDDVRWISESSEGETRGAQQGDHNVKYAIKSRV